MSDDCPRKRMMCDNCGFRRLADRLPTSVPGRLWAWHTRFCPGWKRYVKARFEHGEAPPERGSRRGYWEN